MDCNTSFFDRDYRQIVVSKYGISWSSANAKVLCASNAAGLAPWTVGEDVVPVLFDKINGLCSRWVCRCFQGVFLPLWHYPPRLKNMCKVPIPDFASWIWHGCWIENCQGLYFTLQDIA